MTVNLLELVEGQLSGSVMSNLGGLLGTSRRETAHAVAATAPALLGHLVTQGSTEDGIDTLDSVVSRFDNGLLDNLGALFGAQAAEMSELGSDLLAESLDDVTDTVAQATRLGRGKIALLLKMLAPVAFGVLAQQRSVLGTGATGTAELLAAQEDFLVELPPTDVTPARGSLHMVASKFLTPFRPLARSTRRATGSSADRAFSDRNDLTRR